jgi:hypothetical protein
VATGSAAMLKTTRLEHGKKSVKHLVISSKKTKKHLAEK